MDALHGVVKFAYETGQLKRLPRAGWLLAGVRDPESVAEHSFRVGVLAYIIAALEGADPDRAARARAVPRPTRDPHRRRPERRAALRDHRAPARCRGRPGRGAA